MGEEAVDHEGALISCYKAEWQTRLTSSSREQVYWVRKRSLTTKVRLVSRASSRDASITSTCLKHDRDEQEEVLQGQGEEESV